MASPRDQVWTIAVGQTVSDSVDRKGEDLVGIEFPTGLDGANYSFQVSNDDTTFINLTWEGTAVSFAAVDSDACAVDAAKFAAWRYIKIVSDVAEDPEKEITPVFRRFG